METLIVNDFIQLVNTKENKMDIRLKESGLFSCGKFFRLSDFNHPSKFIDAVHINACKNGIKKDAIKNAVYAAYSYIAANGLTPREADLRNLDCARFHVERGYTSIGCFWDFNEAIKVAKESRDTWFSVHVYDTFEDNRKVAEIDACGPSFDWITGRYVDRVNQ